VYRNSVQHKFFKTRKLQFNSRAPATSPWRAGRKRFLRAPRERTIADLLVQQCCTEFSHPLPPFTQQREMDFAGQPEMGSASARSIRANRMDLMRWRAIEQRANRG
jgi:hypothetical protein